MNKFIVGLVGAVAFLTVASTVYANDGGGGVETGNGGGAWVCRNTDESIRWAKLIDLYEMEFEIGSPIVRDTKRTAGEQVAMAISNLRKYYTYYYKEGTVKVLQYYISRAQDMVTKGLRDVHLTVINDVRYRVSPIASKTCAGGALKYEQLANYTKYGSIIVDSEIYGALDSTDQAGLAVHEAVYDFLRVEYGQMNVTDSTDARLIVGWIFRDGENGLHMPVSNPSYVYGSFMYGGDKMKTKDVNPHLRHVGYGEGGPVEYLSKDRASVLDGTWTEKYGKTYTFDTSKGLASIDADVQGCKYTIAAKLSIYLAKRGAAQGGWIGDSNLETEYWSANYVYNQESFTLHNDNDDFGHPCLQVIHEAYAEVFRTPNGLGSDNTRMLPVDAGSQKIEYYKFPIDPQTPPMEQWWLLNPPKGTIMTRK